MPTDADTGALAERVIAGDRSAVSEALNLVDDARPARRQQALSLLDSLEGHARGARIGITGAPGAGKSTLLDALVTALRARGRTVGVLAVDPSSQKTGGALLGDRMRLGAGARDAGVFLRSLAAREQLGGLSEVTGPSLDVLVAAFDLVFVETVGVGQSEAEVSDLVDTLIFVAQPAAGDLIQFMKAGILEWPDLFFVNKSDLGEEATRTTTELRAGLELGGRGGGKAPPVLAGSARDGLGIDALVAAIDAHRERARLSGEAEQRQFLGRTARIRTALLNRYGRYGLAQLGDPDRIEHHARSRPASSVDRLVDELGTAIEEAMRQQAPRP